MKTGIFLAAALVFLVGGCATQQSVALKGEEQEIYISSHAGIFPGPDDAISVANAQATIINAKAQAELTKALAKQIEKEGQNSVAINGHYIGIFINDDPRLTAYIPHPEMSQRIKITPGSYAVIITNRIVDKISIYDGWGNHTNFNTFKKGGAYNGIKYDYGVRIHKVR